MTRKYLIVLIWLTCIITPLQAQQIEHYGAQDGLPADLVKTILRDNTGFIWFGTDGGLARYDGKKFTQFTEQIPTPYIKKIIQLSTNQLLVLHDLGVSEIISTQDTAYIMPFLVGKAVHSDSTLYYPKGIYQDSKERIWVMEGHLVRIQKGKILKRYLFETPYNWSSFTCAGNFFEHNNNLWFISFSGHLFLYNEQRDSFDVQDLPIELDKINAATTLPDGTIWLGGMKGIFELKLEGKNLKKIRQISDLEWVSSLVYLSESEIYVSCYTDFLYRMNRSKIDANGFYGIQQVLDINFKTIYELKKGSLGNLWISALNGGYVLQRTYFSMIETRKERYIESLNQSSDQKTAYFTSEKMVAQIDLTKDKIEGASLMNWFTENNEWNERFLFISNTASHHGRFVYAGSNLGQIYQLDTEKRTSKLFAEPMPDKPVFYLATDPQNYVWACLGGGFKGIFRISPQGNIVNYTKELNTNIVVIRAHQNETYLAGESKIFKYNLQTTDFELVTKLSDRIHISDFTFDKNNKLWLATNEGIYYQDNQGFTKLNLEFEHQKSYAYNGIICAADNAIWASCGLGIIRYANQRATIFNEHSGLISKSVGYRGLKPYHNGVLAATSRGVAYVNFPEIQELQTETPVFLQLKTNQQPIKNTANFLRLPHDVYLNLEFSALSYPTKKVDYQYRTESDSVWINLGNKSELQIPRFSAGKHQIYIRAKKQGGYQWSNPKILDFEVLKPWYREWWAYVLFIAVSGLIVWVLVRLNTYRINRDRKRLKRIVEERTIEIRLKNQTLNQQKSEIETQAEELYQQAEELKVQRDNLEEINVKVSEQNTQITQSIHSARMIQKAILPDDSFIQQVLEKPYFVLFMPKDIVSGDFYWINKTRNRIFVTVADCTGHGVPGAFMSMIGHSTISKLVNELDLDNPAEILERLNDEITKLLRQEKTQDRNGMDICFCVLENISDTQVQVSFAGAKNPLYYSTPESTEIQILKADRSLIGGGMSRYHKGFTTQKLLLTQGQMIYLATDGFIDQNDMKRQKFGKKSFYHLLGKILPYSVEKQREILFTTFKEYQQIEKQRDDVTILGIRL